MSVPEVRSKKLKLLKSCHRNAKILLLVLLNKGAEEMDRRNVIYIFLKYGPLSTGLCNFFSSCSPFAASPPKKENCDFFHLDFFSQNS